MRMFRLFLITLLFLILVSCENNSFFKKVDFNDGSYKLIFKYINSDYITSEEDHNFYKKYGHFCISDVDALNSLKGLIKEKTKRPSQNSGFTYMISTVSKGENYLLGIYDLQNEVLFSKSYFKLRIEDIENLSNKFIKVEKLKIQFLTIPSLKKGIELLKESSFHIEHYNKIIESGILEFKGMTTLKTTREAISDIENIKSIEKEIKADFGSINFEYRLVSLSADRDSIKIQIASNVNMENSIADNYVIVKPYSETVEIIPIDVYNIENVDLKNLFGNNNIKYKLIE